jgi:hypothetical protein
MSYSCAIVSMLITRFWLPRRRMQFAARMTASRVTYACFPCTNTHPLHPMTSRTPTGSSQNRCLIFATRVCGTHTSMPWLSLPNFYPRVCSWIRPSWFLRWTSALRRSKVL